MDAAALAREHAPGAFPVGVSEGEPWRPDYDVSAFDGRGGPDTISGRGGRLVRVRHCSLGESRSAELVRIDGMRVARDDGWELRMLLSRVREGRGRIYADRASECLVEALFCSDRARRAAGSGDPLAACWAKCAALYAADAALLSRGGRPGQAGSLRGLRGRAGAAARGLAERIGMERATPSLLARMAGSTCGFSDMAEGNGHSAVIAARARAMSAGSLLADCYLYLARVNRDNMALAGRGLARMPAARHVLPPAMDAGAGAAEAAALAAEAREAARGMLSGRGRRGRGPGRTWLTG